MRRPLIALALVSLPLVWRTTTASETHLRATAKKRLRTIDRVTVITRSETIKVISAFLLARGQRVIEITYGIRGWQYLQHEI